MTFEELRDSAGLTREELAVKCRVSAGTIQNWEKGRSIPNGSADAFIRYCAAYGCSLEDIKEAGRVSGYLR
jgi:DNA-binding transcriptional regulator YiaG